MKERTVHARGHFHGIILGAEEAVCSLGPTRDGGKDTGWALGNTEGASGLQPETSEKAEMNPQVMLKIREFCQEKAGKGFPGRENWLSKEQRQEAMGGWGGQRSNASSLGRGRPAMGLQRRVLELCHVLKGPQKKKSARAGVELDKAN